jgi:hypothetical protein
VLQFCPAELCFRKLKKYRIDPLRPFIWIPGKRGRICSRCGSLHPDNLQWYLKRAAKGMANFSRDVSGHAVIIEDDTNGEFVFMLAHAPQILLPEIRTAVLEKAMNPSYKHRHQ